MVAVAADVGAVIVVIVATAVIAATAGNDFSFLAGGFVTLKPLLTRFLLSPL
jgi:hypothetical protein